MNIHDTLQACAVGLALALCSPAAMADPQRPPVTDKAASSVTMGDKSWLKMTHKEGIDELRLGQLAAQRGSSSAVKAFGQQMVADHSKMNLELKKLADKKGIQLDKPAIMSADYNKLDRLSGAQFDKEYISIMLADHKEDVASYGKQAKQGGDPNLTAWAAKQLPTLQHHLNQIERIQKGGK